MSVTSSMMAGAWPSGKDWSATFRRAVSSASSSMLRVRETFSSPNSGIVAADDLCGDGLKPAAQEVRLDEGPGHVVAAGHHGPDVQDHGQPHGQEGVADHGGGRDDPEGEQRGGRAPGEDLPGIQHEQAVEKLLFHVSTS